MQFLPSGVTPYQQYIHDNQYSLAWILKSLGYQTMATHPYYAKRLESDKYLPSSRFSNSTFLEDYTGYPLLRDYVSDRGMYEYILEKIQQPGAAPIFLFGITMQNHGGYSGCPDVPEQIYLEAMPESILQRKPI